MAAAAVIAAITCSGGIGGQTSRASRSLFRKLQRQCCRDLYDTDDTVNFEIFCIGAEERIKDMKRMVTELRARLRRCYSSSSSS